MYKNKVTPSHKILLFPPFLQPQTRYHFVLYLCVNVCVCVCVNVSAFVVLVLHFCLMSKFNVFAIFSMNIIIDYLILTSFRVIENYVLFKFCKAAGISSYLFNHCVPINIKKSKNLDMNNVHTRLDLSFHFQEYLCIKYVCMVYDGRYCIACG